MAKALDPKHVAKAAVRAAFAQSKRAYAVALKLIRLVEMDNDIREGRILSRLKHAKSSKLLEQLETGVAAMIAAGCRFTKSECYLFACGEQTEMHDHFKRFKGFKKADKALGHLFDPERSWMQRDGQNDSRAVERALVNSFVGNINSLWRR